MSLPCASRATSTGAEIAAATARLSASGVEGPRREAQLLLAHVLGQDSAHILAHGSATLSRVDAAVFRALVQRRARREPFAYLSGERAWLDIMLEVDRNVLIPRPETELLAQAAIVEAERLSQEGMLGAVSPVVVDVGTGSGAIAIAVARGCPAATVYGTDASPGALRMASYNGARLARGGVHLLSCNLLDALPIGAHIVVANLPYIPTGDLADLAPELAYEPRSALDGGPDGLVAIRALFAQASAHLVPHNARLLLECGHDQAERVALLAAGRWPEARIDVQADLAGIRRFVHVYLPG
jgi:release factor glutamine methyltransferase